MTTQTSTFTISLIKKEQIAADAYSFFFERPKGFDFLPGQYMRLTLEIAQPDERANWRFFTIASSPTEQDHLMITTRIIQSAFKKTLKDMQPGTKATMFAPLGKFILNEEEKDAHVFLAGGIGITPLHSMIRYAADKKLSIPVTLFTSFRTVEDIVYAEELRDLAKNNSWLTLIETVTRPEESKQPWSGITGRINEELIKKHVFNLLSCLFYVSGPPAMVDALAGLVKSLGVPEERVRVEKFTGY